MGWTTIANHFKELLGGKIEMADGGSAGDRKMSTVSTASMKTKWLKAFKSLKTSPTDSSNPKDEKRNGKEGPGVVAADHQFQEYTYKKITPCDVCSQVLRGHTRQGLKCRVCKLNVHLDCQERVGRCQAKSRLLRRQKSSSEIETRPSPTPNSTEDPQTGHLQADDRRSASPGGRSKSVTFRTPQDQVQAQLAPNSPTDYNQAGTSRRRKLFSVRSFTVFGTKSQERASSLPENEQVQYAAGTRPFGQPLVLPGGASSSGSPPQTPSPRIPKRNE